MSSFLRATVSFLLIALFVFSAMADTIRLKDGSRIKGKIVSFTGGKFVVATGEGSRRREMTIAAAEVDSIDFEAPMNQSHVATVSDRTYSPPTQAQPKVVTPQEESEVIKDEPVSAPPSTTVNKKVSYAKPIELSVRVLADNTANGWTNSGWVVKRGQKIRVTGSGQVSLGRGKSTGPSGIYDLEDSSKLLKSVPTGALIAVIGDDNNEFIYIGSEREFVASRDGVLFLGVNEGNLSDNTGSFDVKVEIAPDSGE